MRTLTAEETRSQTAGGVAALYIATALLAAMPYFLLVVDYLSAQTTADKLALVIANYSSMYAMYLVTYVFYGIALGAVAFALHDRLRDRAPILARLAAAAGGLWSVMLVASGMIFNYGMTTVVALAETDVAQARLTWQAVEPIAQALGGAGGELLGGLWILLVSSAALKSGALPRPLAWFGVVLGVIGLASTIPPARDAAMLFGVMLIVWFIWMGVVLLGARMASARRTARSSEPHFSVG